MKVVINSCLNIFFQQQNSEGNFEQKYPCVAVKSSHFADAGIRRISHSAMVHIKISTMKKVLPSLALIVKAISCQKIAINFAKTCLMQNN